jgi:hypothetical protein
MSYRATTQVAMHREREVPARALVVTAPDFLVLQTGTYA